VQDSDGGQQVKYLIRLKHHDVFFDAEKWSWESGDEGFNKFLEGEFTPENVQSPSYANAGDADKPLGSVAAYQLASSLGGVVVDLEDADGDTVALALVQDAIEKQETVEALAAQHA
jgi:hypothetical protein